MLTSTELGLLGEFCVVLASASIISVLFASGEQIVTLGDITRAILLARVFLMAGIWIA